MHSEVNGDEDIKLKIYKQRNSKLDLKSISEMWTVTQDDIEYKITYIKQITNGNGFHLDVRGIPLFYDKFRTSIIHYLYNGSLTAVDYFTRVFDGTGYNFVLVNPSYAEQWEGFGKGQTRMELFKKGLDRYGYEFYIQGKTIYLKHQIGNDTNFEYRYKLNASNVSKAVDASALITHIKGFGNFEEGEEDYLNNAKLKREATSPLADIVGIREPKVVVDGRITRADTMDARLQKEIDESIYITVEATLHDVRQMGYETAVPLKGDRTFLVDERLGFDAEIRVQSVTTTKDERNRITQCDVVFGSANAGKRFKANLSTVAKNMADLLAGKIQLPFDVLESMSKDLLLKIKSVDSELLLDNGIFAIDKANPNNILGLNSAGIYISTDGGATAQTVITADGIVANSITSGQLLTHLVRVVGTEGLFSIDGDVAKWTNANNTNNYTEISPAGANFMGGSINIKTANDDKYVRLDRNGLYVNKGSIQIKREDAFVDSNGKQFGLYMQDGIPKLNMNAQRNQFMDSNVVSWTGQRYQMSGQNMSSNQTYNMETVYNTHDHKLMTVGFGSIVSGSASAYVLFEVVEIGGGVVASSRQYVQSGETVWGSVTVNVGVPDFSSPKAYYLRAGLETVYNATYLQVVINRVSMHG